MAEIPDQTKGHSYLRGSVEISAKYSILKKLPLPTDILISETGFFLLSDSLLSGHGIPLYLFP